MTDAPKTIAEMPAPKPCPFCGSKPFFGLTKKTGCQLHGEPMQHVTLRCGGVGCPAREGVVGGDVYNGGVQKARDEAIAKWNRRALPADDAEMVEKVARAIADSLLKGKGADSLAYVDEGLEPGSVKTDGDVNTVELARAALFAMRGEP